MMQSYDLYGSAKLSINELRDAIERALGIKFDLHDSAYKGGDYFRAGKVGETEELVIQRNNFEFENEPETAEPKYASYPVIFWVAWTERGDELRQKLEAISDLRFLRRQTR